MKVFVRGREVRFVHNDAALNALRRIGIASIRRASHVEPDGPVWRADMSPVGIADDACFASRRAALAWEVAVLEQMGAPFPKEAK